MSELKVTDTRLFVSKKRNQLGFGSIVLNDCLEIQVNIMTSSKNGNSFVAWPSYAKEKDGKTVYQYVAKITDRDISNSIDNEILTIFNKLLINTDTSTTITEKKTSAKDEESVKKEGVKETPPSVQNKNWMGVKIKKKASSEE